MRIFTWLGLLLAVLAVVFSFANIAEGSLFLLLAVGVVSIGVGSATGM